MLSIILMNLGLATGATPSYNDTLFQGDIILSEAQRRMIFGDGGGVTRHNAAKDKFGRGRWPNGRVPYYISSSFSRQWKRDIERAMEIYKNKTCIEFVPVSKNSREHFVYIQTGKATECSSALGREKYREENWQPLTLGNRCSNGT